MHLQFSVNDTLELYKRNYLRNQFRCILEQHSQHARIFKVLQCCLLYMGCSSI